MSPVLSGKVFSGIRSAGTPSILDAKYIVHVTSGRVALAMALQHAGIGLGNDVLLPAYHCESMVSPVRWTGARAVFYRITANTAIDMDDLKHKLTPTTRAVVITHFFGFPQDVVALRTFCDKHNLVMIEDCAHAFFGMTKQLSVGSVGDYAIASAMKFFAVYDGGCLASNTRDISSLRVNQPNFLLQLKCAFNIVERALHYQRLRPLTAGLQILLRTKDRIWRMMKMTRNSDKHSSYSPSSAEGEFEFDPAWMNIRMSLASRWILSQSMHRDTVSPRRRNFLRLLEATHDLPGCRPLLSALPDGIVPLVFPLYADSPEIVCAKLRYDGVPVWRFGEFLDHTIDSTACAVSTALSRHLLQFPCHQELREDEMAWLIGRVRAAFCQSGEGSPHP